MLTLRSSKRANCLCSLRSLGGFFPAVKPPCTEVSCSVVRAAVLGTGGASSAQGNAAMGVHDSRISCTHKVRLSQNLSRKRQLEQGKRRGGPSVHPMLGAPSHWVQQGEGGSDSALLRCPEGLIAGHHEPNGVLRWARRAVRQLAASQAHLSCTGTEFGFWEDHDTKTTLPSRRYRVSAKPRASQVGSGRSTTSPAGC